MLLAIIPAIQGQTSSGRISGTVTDLNGAVVASAVVTIIDTGTNTPRTATTDSNGFYTLTNLPVGTYTVSVEAPNFKKAVQSGNVLNADGRLTVDFTLTTGQISEVVEVVQESGETVNTTSGEVAKVIDSQQVDNLALNGRNYLQLLSVIPGAVTTTDDALTTSLDTDGIIVNGNRGRSNNLTVDGANNLNAGSNASQINNVGVDLIQEVKIQTSNFSAEYGRNSGVQVNVISKRGSNRYRGSAFEFLRNDLFDARESTAVVKPFLRYHNYGYTFGGPMPFFNFGEGGPMFTSGKDKFFFFFGQEWKSIHRFSTAQLDTLPTTAELNGDFSLRFRGADGIAGTADDGFLRDPSQPANTCARVNNVAVRTGCFRDPSRATASNPLGLNIIPVSRITPDGRATANVYRAMQGLAAQYIDTPTAQNAVFQPPVTSDFRQESMRMDYTFNPKHTIFGRYTHDSNFITAPYGVFIGSSLPTAQQARVRPGNGLQLGHLWNATPNLVNEFKFNKAWTRQRIIPNSNFSSKAFYGYSFTPIYPNGGESEDSIPNLSYGNGGISSFSGAVAFTGFARDYALTDTLTLIRGNHTFKFGGLFNYSAIKQNGTTNYNGTVNYNGSLASNPNTTTFAFADALLGNFRTYTETRLDPFQDFRFQQYEAFAIDSWRVSRKLSLELGVRWQYGVPFYSATNTIVSFDPAYYDPARAMIVSPSGQLSFGPNSNRYNGLVRPDAPIPDVYQDFPGVNTVPAVARRGFIKGRPYFMPRVGFSYSPFKDNKTALRGGFGMYYDRIEGNVIFPLGSNPPFVTSASYENANLNSISSGRETAPTLFGNIVTIDPDMKTSYTMNFSLGVQRTLPWGLFVEANAVGNLGRHLTRQRDINQVPLSVQIANPGANQGFLRRFKGYTSINQRISESTSHYYAMQLYAAKRKGDLLFTTSYTWSKVLANAASLFDQAEEGSIDKKYGYGPASFDRTHVISATYTYAPRWFKKSNGFVKFLLDGYEISGITRFQTGSPLTITAAATVGGTRRANLIPGVDIYIRNDRQWLNPAAFAGDRAGRLGNTGVGIARGPSFFGNDFSVRKRFRFSEKRDLRLQADIFNAFNRNNFAGVDTSCGTTSPTGVCTDDSFGKVNSAGRGRSIQLGVKLSF